MVFRKNYRRRKGNSTAKLLIWLAVLIVIAFAARAWFIAKKRVPVPMGQATTTPVNLVGSSTQSTWSKLRDREGIFEVAYPRRLLKLSEKQVFIPPTGAEKAKALVLTHTIPVKHCGLSGLPEHCTASTTDFSLAFYTVNRSFNDIFKDLRKVFGDLPVVTVDGHQGVQFDQGVEGEGQVYLVLPVNDAKTMFIGRTYLNEQVLAGYQGVRDFIKFADQKILFDQIMGTFKFRPAF
jgi:hypothetical protein